MSLPKLSHPTFSLKLPSTQQEIIFRPFLVREEKILLIAQQGKEKGDIVRAIRQVVQNCIITEAIDVSKFTTFDLEYFFIKLRARSVNNIVSLTYKDNEDSKEYKFEIDLDEIEVKMNPKHTNIVHITKTMQLVLKYPRIDIMDKVAEIKDSVVFSFEILEHCLDKLIITKAEDEDEVILFSEQTKQEIAEFLNDQTSATFKKIQKFFDTMPRLEHILEYTNEKGRKQRIELRTLEDFFTLG